MAVLRRKLDGARVDNHARPQQEAHDGYGACDSGVVQHGGAVLGECSRVRSGGKQRGCRARMAVECRVVERHRACGVAIARLRGGWELRQPAGDERGVAASRVANVDRG